MEAAASSDFTYQEIPCDCERGFYDLTTISLQRSVIGAVLPRLSRDMRHFVLSEMIEFSSFTPSRRVRAIVHYFITVVRVIFHSSRPRTRESG